MKRYAGLFMLVLAGIAAAQSAPEVEPAVTLLDRGYVARWLAFGPVQADVSGGIASALRGNARSLGSTDYFQSVGGITKLAPKDGLEVSQPDGVQIWRVIAAQDEALDLSGMFRDRREGVAFAAFTVQADEGQKVLLEVEALLAPRIFLNGYPVHEAGIAKPASAPIRTVLTLKTGPNVVMLQCPFISLEAAGEAMSGARKDLDAALAAMPRVKARGAWTIFARIMPLRELAGLLYAPRLDSAGDFEGGHQDPKQNLRFHIFNPGPARSARVSVGAATIEGPDKLGESAKMEIPSIAPGALMEGVLPVRLGAVTPGQIVEVRGAIATAGKTAMFDVRINALKPPEAPALEEPVAVKEKRDYEQRALKQKMEDERETLNRRHDALDDALKKFEKDTNHTFDLGEPSGWKTFVESRPEDRSAVEQALTRGRCIQHAGLAVPDERIVDGETLARNIAMGVVAARNTINEPGRCYFVWDTPGIAPQTPQLLSGAGIVNIAGNLPQSFLPALFDQYASDASRVLHLRMERSEQFMKQYWTPAGVTSKEDQNPAMTLFRATLDSGTVETATARTEEAAGRVVLGETARPLNLLELGSVASQPDTKRAQAGAESLLASAEKSGSLASLAGAVYPEESLDFAWRQVLFAASPDRLGLAPTPRAYFDALHAYRNAADSAATAMDRSLRYVAGRVETKVGAPGHEDGIRALLIHNSTSAMRTDVCIAALPVEETGEQLSLFDEDGASVPFALERINISGKPAFQVTFIAKNVPSMGYITYYLKPEGPKPDDLEPADGLTIENELYSITVDPEQGGAIRLLTDKGLGKQYAVGLLNDIAAFEEDADAVRQGQHIRTKGEPVRARQSKEVKVRRWVSGWRQRLRVDVSFLGGLLVREMTLYTGLPRVDCETWVDGAKVDDRLLAAQFELGGGERVPVMGERFGMQVAPLHRDAAIFDSAVPEESMRPALRWFAYSPGDCLQIGQDISVMLRPCAIVYGAAPELRKAALDLRSFLFSRGIAATVWPDSTAAETLDAPETYGTSMRILLGGPEQNAWARRATAKLPTEVIARLVDPAVKSAHAFYRDATSGATPVPTLMLTGNTVAAAAGRVAAFITTVGESGQFALARQEYVPTEGEPRSDWGLGLVYAGTQLAIASADGVASLLLSHPSKWNEVGNTPAVAPLTDSLRHRYMLLPHAYSWRKAGFATTAQAMAEPLRVSVTGLHTGMLPSRYSLLTPEDSSLILTAMKPLGYEIAARNTRPLDPRTGLFLRGYEASGGAWESALAFTPTIASAERSSALELRGAPLSCTENRLVYAAKPGAIVQASVRLEPPVVDRELPEALEDASEKTAPVYSRFWLHNAGDAPEGYMPVSVLLDGSLADGNVTATVSNNLARESIRGTLSLEAPAGWGATPSRFDYNLGPREFKRVELRLTIPQPEKGKVVAGGLIARTTFGARVYFDVLQSAETPFDVKTERVPGEMIVTVSNRTALPLEGQVALIAPTAWWPSMAGSRRAEMPGCIEPGEQVLSCAAAASVTLRFRLDGEAPPWVVAKVAANGKVEYRAL